MEKKHYPSLGQCIFCLRPLYPNELTDEHVVALALNGTLIFEKATCKRCQKIINDEYENAALQNDLLVSRLVLGFKRRKKKLGKRLPKVSVDTDADIRRMPISDLDIELDASEYPAVLKLIMWEPPGFLCGKDRSAGFRYCRIALVPSLKNPLLPKDVTKAITFERHAPYHFATTIAKIAYCYAVAERGLNSFDGAAMRQLLTGERNDVMNFVGNDLGFIPTPPRNVLHAITLRERNGWLTADVTLFASYGAPPYQVAIGKITS